MIKIRIFFDTEFTGLHKDTTLISIGLVSEKGQIFYAEITDYDKSQVDDWIQKNVIDNLILSYVEGYSSFGGEDDKGYSFEIQGSKEEVGKELKRWLDQFKTIEWVSDVCHYDFVLLIDLAYGHALKMPYGIHNAACHDINQDIAKFYGISEIEAFDKCREEIVKGTEIKGSKHNALYDAVVIKRIYEILSEKG